MCYLPIVFAFTFREIGHYAMFRVVECALIEKRPMPAPGSFKAQQAQPGQFGFILCLHTLIRKSETAAFKAKAHLFQRSFFVIVKAPDYLLHSPAQHHCQHSLTALEIGGLMYILNIQDYFRPRSYQVFPRLCRGSPNHTGHLLR